MKLFGTLEAISISQKWLRSGALENAVVRSLIEYEYEPFKARAIVRWAKMLNRYMRRK